MFRKYLVTLLGLALLSLTACGEPETPKPVQGNEFVEIVEMDSLVSGWRGLRCTEDYQTFDMDDMYKDRYSVLGMKIAIESDGEFYDDNEETKDYDAYYIQDWISLKMTLRKNVELPVVIIHTMDTGYDQQDDQTIAPQIGAGGHVDLRLATNNFLGGGVGQIYGLTLCLKVA